MSQVDDFLEHYGVKGMRWGVRKEVKAARAANKVTNARAREIIKEGRLLTDPKERRKQAEKYKTEILDEIKKPEVKARFIKANTPTKGEMIANSILYGPIGYMNARALADPKRLNARYAVELSYATDIYRELRRP